jgi:hypothetical protein
MAVIAVPMWHGYTIAMLFAPDGLPGGRTRGIQVH